MNAQSMDQLFVESYMMMNFEITFSGVRAWFEMGGMPCDDSELFKALLFPEQISIDLQAELTRMIVYRYEDVFFQVSRLDEPIEGSVDVKEETAEPVHQLLLHLMNIRSLRGSNDALIDLGLALSSDKSIDEPLYPSLHSYFHSM